LERAEHGIVAFNHPMNFTKEQLFDQLATRVIIDLFVSIFVLFALSFIPARYVFFCGSNTLLRLFFLARLFF
jgi:hypothetical protein